MIVENTVIPVQNTVMDKTKADIFFETFPRDKVVSYKEYWESIRPQNHDDIFRRYLFSFMSVHTTWESNVKGYNAVKNFSEWFDNKELLLTKIKDSGVGLHNNRTEYIWDFKDKFWSNPKDYIITTKKYHVKNPKGMETYKKIERHWSIQCGKVGVPCYIMRSLYWNTLQKQEDCRYWSHCLES
jgi:hypothetical protein